MSVFHEKKAAIRRALCDSINTPQAMKEINSLVSAGNTYMSGYYNAQHFNHVLVRDVAGYITNLLRIFGVVETDDSIGFGGVSAVTKVVFLFII